MPVIIKDVRWDELVIVNISLFHKDKKHSFKLAIDTGANKTVLRTYVAEMMGFDLQKLVPKTTITSASKNELAYKLTIDKMELDSFAVEKIPVYFKTLPSGIAYLDGLLGLDFFQVLQKRLCFDFKNNEVSLGV